MRLQGTISFEMPASFAPLSASLRHDSIFRPAPPSYFEPAANDQPFKVLNALLNVSPKRGTFIVTE
jgi:hypothetical protein